MLEWHGTLESHGIRMKVDFTNGSVTGYGVAPATFMTKDELTQHIIENSNEFKRGRIKLVRCVILPDEEEVRSNKSSDDTAATTPTSNGEAANTVNETDGSTDEQGGSGEGSSSVKVADKAEAIEWLKEHYPERGYTSSKLRGKAFDEACAECGVEFEFVG